MIKWLIVLLGLVFQLYGGEIWIISIPNSGTHLIQRALKLLEVGDVPYWHPTDNPSDFRSMHNFLNKHPNATIIYNIRDPRDNVVAFLNSFWREPMKMQKKGC